MFSIAQVTRTTKARTDAGSTMSIPWSVRTQSGMAGGTSRQASVTLIIETQSDTVEDVRMLVQAAPALLAALEMALEWMENSVESEHGF